MVTQVHDDGTVDLRYHDDDTERHVAPQYIKINGETLDHLRERYLRERQPKHLCTVIQLPSTNNDHQKHGYNSSLTNGTAGEYNTPSHHHNTTVPDLSELIVKEVDLKNDRFALIHSWLRLPTTLKHTQSIFTLLETILKFTAPENKLEKFKKQQMLQKKAEQTLQTVMEKSKGNDGLTPAENLSALSAARNIMNESIRTNPVQDVVATEDHLFVHQCRLVCLRVLLTLLSTMPKKKRNISSSLTLISSNMVRSIFDLAGAPHHNGHFSIPSQGEPRAVLSTTEKKLHDFVRSPGDSVPNTAMDDCIPAHLIGRVISVSGGLDAASKLISSSSSDSSVTTKRHCTVLFPDGREATYEDKNLEIVAIDGTGLVGTMDVAEAESVLWEQLSGSVNRVNTSSNGSNKKNKSSKNNKSNRTSRNGSHRWSVRGGTAKGMEYENSTLKHQSHHAHHKRSTREKVMLHNMKKESMRMLYSAYGKQTTLDATADAAADAAANAAAQEKSILGNNSSGDDQTESPNNSTNNQDEEEDEEEEDDPLLAALNLYNVIGPIPTFAKPKAEVSLLAPEAFIGARVKVEWPGDDWYPGVIDRYDKETGRHHVFYDDGDTRWYTLTPDRKHAVSESENKLPLRFVGSTISDLNASQAKVNQSNKSVANKGEYQLLKYLENSKSGVGICEQQISLNKTTTLNELDQEVLMGLGEKVTLTTKSFSLWCSCDTTETWKCGESYVVGMIDSASEEWSKTTSLLSETESPLNMKKGKKEEENKEESSEALLSSKKEINETIPQVDLTVTDKAKEVKLPSDPPSELPSEQSSESSESFELPLDSEIDSFNTTQSTNALKQISITSFPILCCGFNPNSIQTNPLNLPRQGHYYRGCKVLIPVQDIHSITDKETNAKELNEMKTARAAAAKPVATTAQFLLTQKDGSTRNCQDPYGPKPKEEITTYQELNSEQSPYPVRYQDGILEKRISNKYYTNHNNNNNINNNNHSNEEEEDDDDNSKSNTLLCSICRLELSLNDVCCPACDFPVEHDLDANARKETAGNETCWRVLPSWCSTTELPIDNTHYIIPESKLRMVREVAPVLRLTVERNDQLQMRYCFTTSSIDCRQEISNKQNNSDIQTQKQSDTVKPIVVSCEMEEINYSVKKYLYRLRTVKGEWHTGALNNGADKWQHITVVTSKVRTFDDKTPSSTIVITLYRNGIVDGELQFPEKEGQLSSFPGMFRIEK